MSAQTIGTAFPQFAMSYKQSPAEAARSALHILLSGLDQSGISITDPLTVTACDDIHDARLFLSPRGQFGPVPEGLNDMETDILEALGPHRMNGRALAEAAGYRLNSHFRSVLSRLRKRGLLAHDTTGYYRTG